MTSLTHGELFAGIGGFAVAAASHGIKTEWHVEIDKNCQAVLHRHFPDAYQFSDVKECGVHNLKPVDIITFGSPCQDLSVAGKREGLKGERSGLFFEAVRIINELSPKWAVWENVPGALSSHKGADFQAVLSALLDADIPMPRSGRWATAGVARTGCTEVSWRILDAQYFGLAQRRRRLFVVVGFGDRSSSEVLFEREGVRWNTAPSRETGKEVAYSLRANPSHSGDKGDGGINTTMVAQPLRSGRQYSDMGDGQSNVIATGWDSQRARIHDVDGVAPTLQRGASKSGNQIPSIAFRPNNSSKARSIAASVDVSPTIPSEDSGNKVCVAFDGRNLTEGDVAHTMQSKKSGGYSLNYSPMVFSGEPQEENIFWQNRSQSNEVRVQDRTSPTVSSTWGLGGNNTLMVGVRRLTPVECERLQGFPFGHTDGQSDSTRYRQLGNAVAVPVASWILGRIARAE